MIKKVFKLIFISIISILLISCKNNTYNSISVCDIEVVVMKEEYLPVTIKLDKGDSVEEYIGSVTISDKDKNGYYKSKFKDVTIGIGYYKVNIYRNDSIIIHSEPATSFEPGELIQLKIN